MKLSQDLSHAFHIQTKERMGSKYRNGMCGVKHIKCLWSLDKNDKLKDIWVRNSVYNFRVFPEGWIVLPSILWTRSTS